MPSSAGRKFLGHKGVGIVAMSQINEGETIVENKPYVFVGNWEMCSHCGSRNNVKLCLKCKSIAYCSKECQINDWRNFHKTECSRCYTNIQPNLDEDQIEILKLALRCIKAGLRVSEKFTSLISEMHPKGNDRYAGLGGLDQPIEQDEQQDMAMEFWNLCSHAPSSVLFDTNLIKQIFDQVLPLEFGLNSVSQKSLFLTIIKIQMNAFTIHNDLFQPIGKGVYTIGAMFNHSCAANSIVTYSGNNQVFRAIKPINTGDEITCAYVDLYSRSRKTVFRRDYCFDCSCSLCTEPHSVEISEILESLSKPPDMNFPIFDTLVEKIVVLGTLRNPADQTDSDCHCRPVCSPPDIIQHEILAKLCLITAQLHKLENIVQAIKQALQILHPLNQTIYKLITTLNDLAQNDVQDNFQNVIDSALCLVLLQNIIYKSIPHHPIPVLQKFRLADDLLRFYPEIAKIIYEEIRESVQIVLSNEFSQILQNRLESII